MLRSSLPTIFRRVAPVPARSCWAETSPFLSHERSLFSMTQLLQGCSKRLTLMSQTIGAMAFWVPFPLFSLRIIILFYLCLVAACFRSNVLLVHMSSLPVALAKLEVAFRFIPPGSYLSCNDVLSNSTYVLSNFDFFVGFTIVFQVLTSSYCSWALTGCFRDSWIAFECKSNIGIPQLLALSKSVHPWRTPRLKSLLLSKVG